MSVNKRVGEVEKIIILSEKKSSKSVSVKQLYSLTNKTSNQVCVYDQCNGNYPLQSALIMLIVCMYVPLIRIGNSSPSLG